MTVSEHDVKMIIKELKEIKKELKFIKEHMVDIDVILTAEEVDLLNIARKEYESGKTIRLNDVKRDLL